MSVVTVVIIAVVTTGIVVQVEITIVLADDIAVEGTVFLTE